MNNNLAHCGHVGMSYYHHHNIIYNAGMNRFVTCQQCYVVHTADDNNTSTQTQMHGVTAGNQSNIVGSAHYHKPCHCIIQVSNVCVFQLHPSLVHVLSTVSSQTVNAHTHTHTQLSVGSLQFNDAFNHTT